jgi:hypothetical protein
MHWMVALSQDSKWQKKQDVCTWEEQVEEESESRKLSVIY